MQQIRIIEAAGGNATAISILPAPLSRSGYEDEGGRIMSSLGEDSVEQVGFLIPSERHFEMAGGEFCGNATRAAALLLAELNQGSVPEFTVSGFVGTVRASVSIESGQVDVIFEGMTALSEEKILEGGRRVAIVDLGGIVHVLVQGSLPNDYQEQHHSITDELGLTNRSAVGVVWYRLSDSGVQIDPVVWVRSIDTFFYESSCGSGSIAAAAVTGRSVIAQPSGQDIVVSIGAGRPSVSLSSAMRELPLPVGVH